VIRELLYELGGRQFLAVMTSGAGSFVLCWNGMLSDGSYVAVTLGIIGAYIAGDAYVSRATLKGTP
jgi:hypothetical protein